MRILSAALLGLAFGLVGFTDLPATQPEPVQITVVKEHGRGYIHSKPEVKKRLHEEAFKRHNHRMAQRAANATPPETFDCVALGWVPPIRDQGSCGSCYEVSTADQFTCAWIKSGYGKADDSFKISDQFGMDCHNFGGCNGGNGTEIADWNMKNGFPAERYVNAAGVSISDYPGYIARSSSCRLKSGAKMWKITDWGFATGDQSSRQATVAEIKAAMMAYGVLNISFDAGGPYGSAGRNVVLINGRNIDHETTMVGWDNSKNAWKTRGQWGTTLGDNGYVWMDYRSYLDGVFWVSAGPVVPPKDLDCYIKFMNPFN